MAPKFPHQNQGTVLRDSGSTLLGLRLRGFHPLQQAVSGHFGFAKMEAARPTTPHPPRVSPQGSVWTLPVSLAATQGIPIGFSSSPYYDASVQRVPAPSMEHLEDLTVFAIGSPIQASSVLRLRAPTRGLSQLVAPFFSVQAKLSSRRRGMSSLIESSICLTLGLCMVFIVRVTMSSHYTLPPSTSAMRRCITALILCKTLQCKACDINFAVAQYKSSEA